ncbi:MAG: YdjY domain-containing protein [Lentisphaeria bacterium]|nr:hypothetical protein [Victivallales bacterium]MCR4575176.1 YdjY domain-containing protein [Lentisphaeria bacterium]
MFCRLAFLGVFFAAVCFGQSSTGKLPAGVKRLPDGNLQVGEIVVRVSKNELAFPARFELKEGALEVIIAKPNGRLHETLLVTSCNALQLQTLLYLLHADNGPRRAGKFERRGDLVDIDIEWTDDDGKKFREPIESWITDNRTKKPMERIGWVFVGSTVKDGKFLADDEGNVVINWSSGATLLDSADSESEDDMLHSVNVKKKQPIKHPDVTVVFKPRSKFIAK